MKVERRNIISLGKFDYGRVAEVKRGQKRGEVRREGRKEGKEGMKEKVKKNGWKKAFIQTNESMDESKIQGMNE